MLSFRQKFVSSVMFYIKSDDFLIKKCNRRLERLKQCKMENQTKIKTFMWIFLVGHVLTINIFLELKQVLP